MAKMKDKNSAKSLAMVLITGLTLAAVTLCWFAIMDRSSVEQIKSSVENTESSLASIYYGADANGNIAITPEAIKQYVKVQENPITLENMIPGAEYTYMAKFSSVNRGQTMSLTLEGISNTKDKDLMSSVKLNRRASKINGDKETSVKYTANEILLSAADGDSFKYKLTSADANGEYAIFYTLKITEETKTDKGNLSIEITNVNAIISDV